MMSLMKGELAVEGEELADPNLLPSMLIALTLSTPVLMAYWFAPILVGWWGMSAPKAMFFSFIACLRNWRPFLAFSIAILVMGGLIPGLVLGIVGALVPFLSSLMLLALPLVLIPVLFASFYINAREVFDAHRIDEKVE